MALVERERHGECDLAGMVQAAGIVAKLHLRATERSNRSPDRPNNSTLPVTSAMNIVRSRAGAGDRKCKFCHTAPPTVLGMPT